MPHCQQTPYQSSHQTANIHTRFTRNKNSLTTLGGILKDFSQCVRGRGENGISQKK